VLVCPIERRFWERFCDAVGLPEGWAARGDWTTSHADYGYDDERPVIAERLRARTLDEWSATFEAAELPFAPVLTAAEALASEQAAATALLRPVDVDGRRVDVVRSAVRLADDDAAAPVPLPPARPPALGEHTVEVLAELGLGAIDPAELRGPG
jgi:crotonobetainyl-CoA:carnitine CoA-transferase CaiB-like acyl-CoA transferase